MKYLLILIALLGSGCAPGSIGYRMGQGFSAAGNTTIRSEKTTSQEKTLYSGSRMVGRTQGDSVYYSDGSVGGVR
jgi:hypothetical protein